MPIVNSSGRAVRLGIVMLATGWLLAWATAARGQTATATLFIEARDSTGAALAGVAIRLVNQANALERVATTSASGTASVPLLPAGSYTATARLSGFKTEVVNDLRLEPGGKGTLDLVLVPGSFDETIVVSAAARGLAGGSTLGEAYDGRLLVMMPVENREFLQFTYQSPGAATPAPGSRLSTQANAGVNVSGAREAANNFLLDGVDNNDLFLNRLVVTPSLDAIQEFTLVQNTYDAEYGRNSGAQVNVVSKSGGSTTRGSLFEYWRDEALDARGVFDMPDEPKPTFRRHQFGGTVGGPLARTRSFYFVSGEGLWTRAAETRAAHVPTPLERTGDFSASGVTLIDPLTGAPFPGNRIPTDRLDPAGLETAALYPVPNRAGSAQNLVSAPLGSRDGLQLTVKTDHHVWRNTPFFVRYSLTADDRDQPFPARGRNVPGFGTAVVDVGQNVAAGVSQVLPRGFFNELRVGWNRLRRDNAPLAQGVDGFDALGITGPTLPHADTGYPAFVLAGYETLGDDPNLPVSRRTHTLHVSDSLSIDRGRHHVKVGGEIRHYASDGYNHLFVRGQLTFRGAYSGDALGDLLLGLPSLTLLATNDNPQALRTTAWNLFAQHDWRPTSALTINTGLRYELNQPPVDADDRMRIFDLETLTLVPVGENGVPRSGVSTDWNNLAPRIGVSWKSPGNLDLTVHAGYGLYYDSGTLIENSALYFNPPYFYLQVFFPTDEPLTLADPFPAGGGFRPPPSVNTLEPDYDTAVTGQGSLGVDWRARGVELGARYAGAHGEHLVRRRNINQPVPGPGPLDPRRPIAGYGDILLVEPAAASSYHALQLRAERQRADGLSLRAAYTWSKSIDDTSAFLPSDGNDNTPQQGSNPGAERGLSDFDVRHRLSAAAVWALPERTDRWWARGWQLSAILAVQSGRPFTPRVGFDNSNTGNVGGSFGYDRPNEVARAHSPPDAVHYGGRAFVIAPPYTFGNAGRNILIGPAFASLDASVGRLTRIGSDSRLEVRLEVYNALNRDNLGLPDSFVDRPTFGQSLSAFPARQLQIVARYEF
jgi:Carboxypeptidase regulatory-like domain